MRTTTAPAPMTIGIDLGDHATAEPQHPSARPHRQAKVAHGIGLQQTELGRDGLPPLQDNPRPTALQGCRCPGNRSPPRLQHAQPHDGPWSAGIARNRALIPAETARLPTHLDRCNNAGAPAGPGSPRPAPARARRSTGTAGLSLPASAASSRASSRVVDCASSTPWSPASNAKWHPSTRMGSSSSRSPSTSSGAICGFPRSVTAAHAIAKVLRVDTKTSKAVGSFTVGRTPHRISIQQRLD